MEAQLSQRKFFDVVFQLIAHRRFLQLVGVGFAVGRRRVDEAVGISDEVDGGVDGDDAGVEYILLPRVEGPAGGGSGERAEL